jgi:signal transduction histidine kinase
LRERQKRIVIAIGIGILLTLANYATQVLFARLGVSVADNPFDDLLLGTVGGLLAYIWVTLLEERESRMHLAQQIRQEALSEERNRVARELHDTLAQGFTGVVIQLEAAEDVLTVNTETARAHILRARSLARESLSEARRSALALRLQALKDSDLPTALARFAAHLTAGTSVQAEFVLHGVARPLPPEKEDNLLRITQEALTNVLRHANARKVRIDLSYNPRHVRLSIEDDGQGLNPGLGNGLGLNTMRERAELIGGKLSVSSRPGEGTRIDAFVPVP